MVCAIIDHKTEYGLTAAEHENILRIVHDLIEKFGVDEFICVANPGKEGRASGEFTQACFGTAMLLKQAEGCAIRNKMLLAQHPSCFTKLNENVPDSFDGWEFFEGGDALSPQEAVERAERAMVERADVLLVGSKIGCSPLPLVQYARTHGKLVVELHNV